MAQTDGSRSIAYGPRSHQNIEPETASKLLTALFEGSPQAFGYYLALAVTGIAPSAPRAPRQAAPDRYEPERQGADGGE
jgi:hypothetical protein